MKKVFIMLLMPVAVFMGCSKNNESTPDEQKPDEEKNCGVSKIIESWGETRFEYDDKGRVIFTEESGYEDFIYSDKFSYSESRIEVKRYENDKLGATYEYKIDNSGKITQAKETHINNASITNYIFTYNNNGYLAKVINQDGIEMELNLVYDNGNLAARLLKYNNGQSWSEYNDEFTYTDEPDFSYSSYFGNIFADFFGEFHKNVLYEHGYFGKKSKNRLTDIKVHEKDSKGRPTKLTGAIWSEGTIQSIQYLCDK